VTQKRCLYHSGGSVDVMMCYWC